MGRNGSGLGGGTQGSMYIRQQGYRAGALATDVYSWQYRCIIHATADTCIYAKSVELKANHVKCVLVYSLPPSQERESQMTVDGKAIGSPALSGYLVRE